MKKLIALVLAILIILSVTAIFAGCDGSGGNGTVYFLNFKPEQDEQYQAIAKEYTEKTGVAVTIVTAASGTYETQLKSELAKREAPTIFQINGPVGYASWKDYTADLKGTEIYSHLADKSLAITDGDGVFGIPFVIEGYGIIYNKTLLEKYIATSGAKITAIDQINNFGTLKEVAEDIQAKKVELGVDGAFASTSLKGGEDWRWQTHLANIPLYYEFKNNNVDLKDASATAEITFQYAENYKNLFDLYINNSTTDKGLLGSKAVGDSMAEFALGKAVFVQNGNWAYGQIADVAGNVVKPEDVAFLPLYIGIDGESTQGIAIGSENFFCINSQASAENQKASLDFLTWLYTSEEGKAHVKNDLGFIAPFDTFTDEDKPTDPLGKAVAEWSANPNVQNVPWNFTIFPSQNFKDAFGQDLLQYAQGTLDWQTVKTNVIENWK
jgi:raffinose/stachyose/melibiose transport system substrate-binding protein